MFQTASENAKKDCMVKGVERKKSSRAEGRMRGVEDRRNSRRSRVSEKDFIIVCRGGAWKQFGKKAVLQ